MNMNERDDMDDAALRALLREDHIDDAGFTERVTSTLPARSLNRTPRRVGKRDLAIIGGAFSAGATGAVVVASGGLDIAPSLPWGGVLPLAVVVVVALWGLIDGALSEQRR